VLVYVVVCWSVIVVGVVFLHELYRPQGRCM
jgi:hypothetical protein